MAPRVSNLKDNVRYLTEEDKNIFMFSSHTPTVGKAYGMEFQIRKDDGFWQVLDVDQAGQSYWSYLTTSNAGGRRHKSRKNPKFRKYKKATRRLKR
jgi:hypothetical protein